MGWWWTMLALAGPVAVETPTVQTPLPYPTGVESSLVAREMVTARSESVRFSIDGKPKIVDGRLVVRGVLENTGTRSTKVYLISAPQTGGPFQLAPRDATFSPTIPADVAPVITEVAPQPEELVLPAKTKVPFESSLTLGSWTWPDGGAEIDWSFQFWSDPVSGTLPGRLNPPKRKP